MSSIPGVTRAAGPEGGAEVDQTPTATDSGYFITYAPADALDAPRIAAREATYPNSTTEAAHIRATDEAVFDRVRPFEQHLVQMAESHLAHGGQKMQEVVGLIEELEDIRSELRAGGDTAALAKRYNVARAKIQRSSSVLRGLEKSTDTLRVKAADPLAAAQEVISKMPRSSFNPVNPAAYLDR